MGGGEESLRSWASGLGRADSNTGTGKLFGHGFSRSESVLPDLDYRLIWP